MLHQPLGGVQGDSSDLELNAKMILHTRDILNTYLAEFCDRSVTRIQKDCERDFYLTPKEAKKYGVIDEVIQHKNMKPSPKMPLLTVR